MEVIDINERQEFRDQFAPKILHMSPAYKVPLICMEVGQKIPPHSCGAGVFYIISGKAVMTVDDKQVEVKAGDMILIDDGEARGIEAIEQLTAFAVQVG